MPPMGVEGSPTAGQGCHSSPEQRRRIANDGEVASRPDERRTIVNGARRLQRAGSVEGSANEDQRWLQRGRRKPVEDRKWGPMVEVCAGKGVEGSQMRGPGIDAVLRWTRPRRLGFIVTQYSRRPMWSRRSASERHRSCWWTDIRRTLGSGGRTTVNQPRHRIRGSRPRTVRSGPVGPLRGERCCTCR